MSWATPSRTAALLLILAAIVFAAGAYRLGFWSAGMPESGVLPFAAAVLLLPLSLLLLLEKLPEHETRFTVLALLGLGLVWLYAFAAPYVGLVPATLCMVTIWVRFLYRQTWLSAVAFSIGLTVSAALVFNMLLRIPLPLLPDWL